MKKCTGCGIEKHFTEFYKRIATKSGLESCCITCQKLKAKKQYNENKENVIKRATAWRHKNHDRVLQHQKNFHARHREELNKQSRDWYANHTKQGIKTSSVWRAANPEKVRGYQNAWRLLNKHKIKELNRVYASLHPDKFAAKTAKRNAIKVKATPCWANQEKMQNFYTTANMLGMHLGIWHEVDHIVPLQGDLVCGLHCEFNLQILTITENRSKHNNFIA